MRDKKAEIATTEDLKAANIITNITEAIAIVESSYFKFVYRLVIKQIKEYKAIVAVTEDTTLVGFFYNTVLHYVVFTSLIRCITFQNLYNFYDYKCKLHFIKALTSLL